MTPEEKKLLDSHVKEIAKILYKNAPPEKLETFEGIETAVRDQVLEHVNPKIAFFFISEKTGTDKGRIRKIRSCVGKILITRKQALRLGIEPYRRFSPLLEKCCLLLSANESFKEAEKDLKVLTGIEVGHSTHHRQVKKVELSMPNVKQKLTEVCLDGGMVRLRSEKKGESAYWKEYKTGRLQGIYYGAFFQDNLSLTDWINSQNTGKVLYCLGDGHDGIWKLYRNIAHDKCRHEILDWYHLKENLYKIQASKKFLLTIEADLWQGFVEEAIKKLRKTKYVGVTNFIKYLSKHRHRLVNYMYFQAEQLSSVGSGAVESAVKQIDKRMQIVGAQWKSENLPQMLQLRCAYLNGQLAAPF